MTTAHVRGGYVADDLLWARDAYGTAHLEIDPWGNLIVSPTGQEHEDAIVALLRIFIPLGSTISPYTNLGFRAPGGSGHLNVPDLLVLPSDVRRDEHDHLSGAPLVVVEVASPSTRTIDRTRKADDYALAHAAAYLLVDLPDLAPNGVPTVEVRRLGMAPVVHTTAFELHVASMIFTIDPADLVER